MNKLEPCPFCGGEAFLGISDDEGNIRNSSYLLHPYSGLTFHIKHYHEDNPECPIAIYKGDSSIMGVKLYDSEEEAVEHWNKRVE